jgi:hypothetical protein
MINNLGTIADKTAPSAPPPGRSKVDEIIGNIEIGD